MRNRFTLEELEAHRADQDAGASLLLDFISHAKAYNEQLRSALDEPHSRLGTPIISDEYVDFHTWYVTDAGMIRLVDDIGDPELEIPVHALTGELTPEVWVESLWDEMERKREEYRQANEQRDREKLRQLAEKYPEELEKL